MKLRKRNQKQDPPKRDISDKVLRPKPYQYHAVRSSVDRRDNRGQSVTASKTSPAKRIEKLTTTLIIGVIIFSFLYLFWLDTSPNIRIVQSGSEQTETTLLRDISVYEAGAHDLLDSSMFSRTKLTFNSESYANQLKSAYPELATVTITIPLTGHKPLFDLQAKEPKLLLTNNGVTYVIDQGGVAVARLSDLTSEVQSQLASLGRVTDASRVEVEQGKQIMTSEAVAFLLQTSHQYDKANLAIVSAELPADKPNEVWIKTDSQSYFVKYILTRPADEQFGAYQAVASSLQEQGRQPGEYIDVRVEGKAFYR